MKYCTYLTIYKGNALPPFYIGSSSVARVNNGYRGSPSSKIYKDVWKRELRKSRELFKTVILKTFTTREEAAKAELKIQISLRVHENPLYVNMGYFWSGYIVYNKSPEMLAKIAKANVGRKHSEETKRKISVSNKGKVISQETRQKMSDTRRGRKLKPLSEETKKKISDAQRGNLHCRFGQKLDEEWKRKISESQSGKEKKRSTKINMASQSWKITDADGIIHLPELLSEWCENRGLVTRDVRKSFRLRGKYKDFVASRVK